MSDIHSYEQRSSSELGHELDIKQNRVIIINRRDPSVSWSTSNLPKHGPVRNSCMNRLWRWPWGIGGGAPRPNQHGSKLDNSYSSSSMSISHFDSGPFASNEWRSSKYTLLNFLPKNLFEQFRRMANFYFLTTAILQMCIPYSPVGPTTSLLPLIFVVSTTSIKQAYEDYLRHKLDKEVNNRLCHVLHNKVLVKVRCKDIKVGDFVYVRNNEEIPCDMILLTASNHSDRCYVTTANLDGEMSLKNRSCYQIKEQIGGIEKLNDSLLIVECEKPNATLYEFNGFIRAPKNQRAYEMLLNCLKEGEQNSRIKHQTTPTRGSGQHRPSVIQMILRRVRQNHPSKKSTMNQNANDILNNISDFHEIPLDISNLLLRASRLRNTSHILGLAVFTGRDTKLAHNSQVKPNKFSSIETKVNTYLIFAFLTLMTMSIIGALRYTRPNFWYYSGLKRTDSTEQMIVAHFLLYNYLVPISLYVTLEFIKFLGTISVIDDKKMNVAAWRSVNMTKSKGPTAASGAVAGKALASTTQLESLGSNSSVGKHVRVIEGPKCNSSDLNEELGLVEVLFSDKTGTLTENQMHFTACSIYGQIYRAIGGRLYKQPAELYRGQILNLARELAKVGSNKHAFLALPTPTAQAKSSSNSSVASKPFDHRRLPPVSDLRLIDNIDQHERVVEFFVCLCLCSTVTLNENLPLADCLPDKTSNEYDFQAASPDEESLISAAHLYGISMCKSNDRDCYIVIERSKPNNVSQPTNRPKRENRFKALVETKNSNTKYMVRHFQRLAVFEFNSIRKRMTVIYKDCDNDCLLMVTKGSEELLDCVNFAELDAQTERVVDGTLAHFEAFAKSGLRTLLVCRKLLDQEEFNSILAGLKEARLSINNRDHLLNNVYRRSETNMQLIGTTAVEDTLQEGVPETIASLKEAGIKIWLLTGDKVETAISVAYLCRLLDREMILFQLVRQQDQQACQKLLASFTEQLGSLLESSSEGTTTNNAANVRRKQQQHASKAAHLDVASAKSASGSGQRRSDSIKLKFALIVDGRSLYYAMKYAKSDLAQLCKQCTCILGCRLSPLQKAEVVEMVKKGADKPITAAIGDGANDVSMIQEAHVGIGIAGKEGRQAVNSSDFAIGRFRMLNRLLFVHGHLFYHRSSNTIHYFFYKNLLFILPQFIYSFYNYSSALSIYHPILLIGYNLFFTSLPILIFGLYEIHLPEEILENYPPLYKLNRGNSLMCLSVFGKWMALGAFQAITSFYLLYFNWGSHTPFLESGKMSGINGFSIMLYFVVVFTATLTLYFVTRRHTFCFNVSAILSCLSLPLLLYAYSLVDWSFLVTDNSLYGQFWAYSCSPMFWIAIVTTTSATLIPVIIWYIKHRLASFEILSTIIEMSKQEEQSIESERARRLLKI